MDWIKNLGRTGTELAPAASPEVADEQVTGNDGVEAVRGDGTEAGAVIPEVETPEDPVIVTAPLYTINWAQAADTIDAFEAPDKKITHAYVPCDDAPAFRYGRFSGYPVEQSNEFKVRLSTGELVTL